MLFHNPAGTKAGVIQSGKE